MKILAERLRTLRQAMKMSQEQIAMHLNTTQSSINRYEKQVGLPPHKVLLWYADYFDVSMDYIYGRTDKPQGKLYKYEPRIIERNPEMKLFIEMCFDPNSPMHEKLKQTLVEMVAETPPKYKRKRKQANP